jgi:hypothetical protein
MPSPPGPNTVPALRAGRLSGLRASMRTVFENCMASKCALLPPPIAAGFQVSGRPLRRCAALNGP